ncbi:hypothetical protein [Hallerella succinigenes]|uniref:hypothetical protein n=1 Tax=Hallerella succinigenes TaxID=1896222 RepID=UPI0012FD1572|nr:hypothetical protein [Hallerella succinigenes]
MGEFLTLKELAARIGYNYWTVHGWVDSRGLPVHRATPRGRMTVSWTEFNSWWAKIGA